MIAPKTYVGYDNEGNRIASCTAQNANEHLNPADVQAAIDNIKSVLDEQMRIISTALNNIAPEAGAALIVQGTKMEAPIQEMSNELGKVADSVVDSISSVYTEAVSVHDDIQNQLNDAAYNTIRSTQGVVSVR